MSQRVMMQAFEWYLPSDKNHYRRIISELDHLKDVGINDLWLPPVFKGTSVFDVGYGIYDLFDLGEFDQKGTIATKYGTKDELLALIDEAHRRDMRIYADVVLNHKAAGDYKERCMAVKVNPDNRNETIGEPHEIEAWTGFNFPARSNQYSSFVWNYNHFTGVDYDDLSKETGIYRILGENKYWSAGVSKEKGNYDYLMFSDVNLAHPDVKAEIFRWLEWFVSQTKVDGLRLDALKHIDRQFMAEFANFCKEKYGPDFYIVGEYWTSDEAVKSKYLDAVDYNIDLFDVGLHYNFFTASLDNENYDLRAIFHDTLVLENPTLAVTFVDNHDSQMGQSLQSWVADWFKPLAYALILMRNEGYPCVFWGDYFGIAGEHGFASQKVWLDRILKARQLFGHGQQDDYFDDPNVIGWVRHGNQENSGKSATLVCNAPESRFIKMMVGPQEAGKLYYDLTMNCELPVTINQDGTAEFWVESRSTSIWVSKESTKVF